MIGKILKTMRLEQFNAQWKVAKENSMATTTLSGYESGYRQPTFEVIEKLANYYGYEIIFKNKKTGQELTSKNIERKEL